MIRLRDLLTETKILDEYTEEEKQQLGIPRSAVARGGRWYEGDVYIGKVVDGRFVRVKTADQREKSDSPPPMATDTNPANSEVPVKQAATKDNPSFDELRSAAQKHQFTIMTKQPLRAIKSTNPVGRANSVGKPNGFWFGVGSEWIDWTEEEMPQWKGDNLYAIEVDEKQCVVIENERDLRMFHNQYRTPDGMINWEKVAREYRGIIIKNYIPEARMKYPWFYTWDVASGCVWDASAVKQVNQVSI
jgi:hypothetical protein